jgi:hypothetical protein
MIRILVTPGLEQAREVVREHGVPWIAMHRENWLKKVDPDKLNMQSPRSCILGQAFDDAPSTHGFDIAGRYSTPGFLKALDMYPGLDVVKLGFDTSTGKYLESTPYDHRDLTVAWREAIEELTS